MEKTEKPDLAALETDLEKARQEYEECAEEASSASRRETAAMNRLNEAQKAFDRAVEALKSRHPVRSNWRQRCIPQIPDSRNI